MNTSHLTVETSEGTTQFTFNVNQICASFHHNISGIIEDQDGEFYAMVMNEMYDKPEEETFFIDFKQANDFVISKMNGLINYYKTNFGKLTECLQCGLTIGCTCHS